MGKATETHLDDVITSLEMLCESLQDAVEQEPEQIEYKLQRASRATADMICSSLPGRQRDEWLKELQAVAHSLEDSNVETGSPTSTPERAHGRPESFEGFVCSCASRREYAAVGVDDGQPTGVTCIHGCGLSFCCATCRRIQAREHASKCPALTRKRLLKAMGFSADNELF